MNRAFGSAVLVVAIMAFGGGARAQTPPAGTATAGLTIFSYRVILSGPYSSPSDTDVTFLLTYARVPPPNLAAASVVLTYGDAQFVSIAASSGAAPVGVGPQGPGAQRFELNGDSGTLQVTLRPPAGFAGALTLRFYVPGSGIGMPAGTVAETTTQILPRAATTATTNIQSPRTGGGAAASTIGRRWLMMSLAIASLACIVLTGAFVVQKRR